MTEVKIKILIVEHDKVDVDLIKMTLKKAGVSFSVEVVEAASAFELSLLNFKPDIILSDYNLPSFNGLIAFRIKEKISPNTPFILVSGFIGEENALELIKSGVTDYVLKDKMFVLPLKVTHAVSEAIARFEKLKAIQELKLSEKRLAHAQQLAHMGSWEFDINTGTVTWSKEMYKIYNCDPETFVPSEDSVINLHPHDVQESIRNSYEKIGTGMVHPSLEFRLIATNGSIKYLERNSEVIFDEMGKPIKVTGITQDITERKLMEIDLKQAKIEADRAKDMQDKFLVNMSHEIRTPMNAIVGFSTLLKSEKLSKKENDFIDKINTASENLLGIINDLLDLSKIESGMMQLDKTVVHLPSLLKSVHSIMVGNALNKNLEISLAHPSIPEFVFCDQTRLSQVLINLTSNAIKFTEKGFVSIRAEVISNTAQNTFIKFIIQDSGIGIAKENCELIFERFQQEHSDTTRKYGGSGLGLSIVRNIVKLMGGIISVESEQGKGSQFVVLIPMDKCTSIQITEYKKAQEKIIPTYDLKLEKLNILLAEDNRMNQQYVSSVLEEFGFNCTIAVNGKEAVNKAKENTFDIILMDIQMPEMDGFEATRIIRNELKNNTPIIALTANAAHRDYEQCLKAGMNGYLSKPYKPKDLYNKIAELLSKRSNLKNKKYKEVVAKLDKPGEKIFDVSFLKKQMNGKMDSVKVLLDIFMEETPRDIKELEEAILKETFSLIKGISHNLVSTFSVIGLLNGVSILKAMEHNAEHKKEIMTIKSLFLDLIIITDKTKLEISQLTLERLQVAN